MPGLLLAPRGQPHCPRPRHRAPQLGSPSSDKAIEKIGVEAIVVPQLKQRGRVHTARTHARCPVSGRWPRSTALATARRRALILNARRTILCSATSRYWTTSTISALSMLPPAFAPFARALHARPSPLLPQGAFLGAVPLGPLEQTPQHQQAVEAEPPPSFLARFALVRS